MLENAATELIQGREFEIRQIIRDSERVCGEHRTLQVLSK